MEIIRGTTPTISFTFSDVDITDIDSANMYVKQTGQIVISKSIEDATIGEDGLSFTLSQEDTLLLTSKTSAVIVLDWLSGETRGRSKTAKADVGEPGLDEVMQ